MFQLSLDLYYTEDEIYELSYAKEPKNPKVQVSRAEVNNALCNGTQVHTYFNLFL